MRLQTHAVCGCVTNALASLCRAVCCALRMRCVVRCVLCIVYCGCVTRLSFDARANHQPSLPYTFRVRAFTDGNINGNTIVFVLHTAARLNMNV